MKSILILSDNSEITEVLRKVLTKEKYHFQALSLEPSCMSVTEITQYSLILIELTQKHSPNWQWLPKIIQNRNKIAAPVVAVVDFAPEVVGDKYEVWQNYENEIADFVSLPLVIDELKSILDSFLRRN
jgi:DNA-binding NtrC family response regulator